LADIEMLRMTRIDDLPDRGYKAPRSMNDTIQTPASEGPVSARPRPSKPNNSSKYAFFEVVQGYLNVAADLVGLLGKFL